MMTACWGNPSSLHTAGFEAEREMEAARSAVAGLLGAAPDTLTFTSGGTEAQQSGDIRRGGRQSARRPAYRDHRDGAPLGGPPLAANWRRRAGR